MALDPAGMGAGFLGSALGGFFGSKKDSGTDAGNYFTPSSQELDKLRDVRNAMLGYQGNKAAIDPLESSRIATQEVQNNPILAGLFGKGGQLEQTEQQATDLANRGYSLQPEDYEAYGQASGQIARNFDTAEGGLAQALSARGLSSSGVANQQFMTSQGSKQEQLAQIQTDIAQRRMKTNMDRLNATRQFMAQLGGQAQGAIQGQYGRQLGAEEQAFNEMKGKNEAANQWLENAQGQSNEQLSQRQQTQRTPGWAAGLAAGFNNLGQQGMAAGGAGQGQKK